jgi:predicted glycosyltransferase
MGIGHMRRNMLIAQAFAESDVKPNILMICGAREAALFNPAAGRRFPDAAGDLKGRERAIPPALSEVSMRELSRVRSDVTRAALEAFDPDVLIVDKVPRGALGELDSSLASLRAAGHTRCVLGLRDVLDDPRSSRANGRTTIPIKRCATIMTRSGRTAAPACTTWRASTTFRRMWPRRFGTPATSDAHPMTTRMRTARPLIRSNVSTFPPRADVALCMVGGGQDGAEIALSFARAVLPENIIGVVVTGPFMPPETRQRIKMMSASRPQLRVLEFTSNIEPLLRRAGRVVTMGGYNSVCEVLAAGKRALVVPRVKPRLEQLIRAQSLQRMGLLDVLHPDDLTPEAIARWLNRPMPPPSDVLRRIDFDGTRRLASLLADVLTPATAPCRCQRGAMQHVA